jgi:hypothetical protein
MGSEPIAVVGLAIPVPDAGSAEELWANLLASRNSVHRLTEEQLLEAGEDPAVIALPSYVPARPLLDDVWGFDNEYFGMSRRESELRNPQHRLFLELCDTALQSAGTVPERFEGAIGVYGGCASDRFVEAHIRADPELMSQVGEMVALVSNNIDYLASRGVEVTRDPRAVVDVDHLVVALPLNSGTRGLFDAAVLDDARRGLHLVNLSRSEVVDQDGLLCADGRLAATAAASAARGARGMDA